jgi:DNA-binding MarR family transcriptional regulator
MSRPDAFPSGISNHCGNTPNLEIDRVNSLISTRVLKAQAAEKASVMTTVTTTRNEEASHSAVAPILQEAAELEVLLPRVALHFGMVYQGETMPDTTLRQLRVCALLERGPLTLSEISKELEVCQSAITQMADRMEKTGIVERVPTGFDRRNKYLQLTCLGKERLHLWREHRIQRAQSILGHLSCQARNEVLRTLNMLVSATGDNDEPAF